MEPDEAEQMVAAFNEKLRKRGIVVSLDEIYISVDRRTGAAGAKKLALQLLEAAAQVRENEAHVDAVQIGAMDGEFGRWILDGLKGADKGAAIENVRRMLERNLSKVFGRPIKVRLNA